MRFQLLKAARALRSELVRHESSTGPIWVLHHLVQHTGERSRQCQLVEHVRAQHNVEGFGVHELVEVTVRCGVPVKLECVADVVEVVEGYVVLDERDELGSVCEGDGTG